MISRLKKKGYPPAVRAKVADYLRSNNYINDEEFARLFVSYSLDKGWGPVRIDFNLKRLGIPRRLREQVLKGDVVFSDRMKAAIEEKMAYYKSKSPSLPPQKIRQKILVYMARKGFKYDVIIREIENLGANGFEGR